MSFRPLGDGETDRLIRLWTACGLVRPWNPPADDIAEIRAHPSAEILVLGTDGAVDAAVAVGHDGHRGWVYYLAVDPGRRGEGLGQAAMEAAERWLRERGARKLNVMVRAGNDAVLSFYDRLGFQDGGTRLLEKWLDPAREAIWREARHG